MKLQALDNSVPLSFGEIYAMSPGFVADVFDHHAGWADKIAGETLPPYQGGDHLVLTLREPVGVVGAVIPWNAPLVLFAQKVAPALRRAMRMTKAIKAGTVGVNGYQLEPNSPFGGFRQSGLGREGGRAAIESYTELKTVLLPFTDEMM